MPNKSGLPSKFTIDGISYRRHAGGVIEQINPGDYVYDKNYIAASYETYPKEKITACAILRFGLVLQALDNESNKLHMLLDYGYGNGAFLRAAVAHSSVAAHGLEINGWPIPEGATEVFDPQTIEWDTVCFFDVAEHIPNLAAVLVSLKTKRLIISLPWCHADELGLDWFKTWKHRKPGEHIWHFNPLSLTGALAHFGYAVDYFGNPEDAVRTGVDSLPNILTVIAHRR